MLAELPALIGAHALPVFAALLLGLLLVTGAGWWSAQRHLLPPLRERLGANAAWLALLGLGFAFIVGAGALFAELSEVLDADEELARFDLALSQAIRAGTPPEALAWFGAITRLGDTATLVALCIVVALVLLALRRHMLMLVWVLAVAGNGALNVALKALFARARPVHDGGALLAHGYSFPSGHSSGAVVAYGMLAFVLLRVLPKAWHLPVVLLATAIAFSVGSSRIFLHVHYPSDVLAGFASGAAWLAVCLVAAAWVRRRRRGVSGHEPPKPSG